MAKTPKEKPLIDIPGIEDAKVIELRTRNSGDKLLFQMFVDGQQTRVDEDKVWADKDWFSLIIRELDRRKIWRYTVVKNIFYYVRMT